MSFGSQKANLDTIASNLQGLVHEIYVGEVLPGVRYESITQQLYQNAGEGPFRYDGESLNGATDLNRPHGAMATSGQLPRHTYVDAANWQTTPVRMYVRRAFDNFVERRTQKGPGSFASLGERLLDQMWGAFRLMKIRHAIGGADAILCLVSSRTSTTVWVAKDGYGHTGTDALMLIEDGMVLTHHSTDGGSAEGGGIVSSIAHSTDTVTMTADWEQSAAVAANDIVCAATTEDPTADYFVSENNLAPNGQPEIIDPEGNLTTALNIAEGDYARWKPFRVASSTFDHIEVTEFLRRLEAKSTYPVTPDSHTLVCAGGTYATLARTLMAFQQQTSLGKTLEGGYQAVRIANYDIAIDPFQIHDALLAYCNEELFTVSLVEAGYFDEDGSMYSRIADFDGVEWYARDYGNSFCPARGRNGALTGITHTVTASQYSPVPSY